MKDGKLLLVGDNPFLGVSHLSQERAIARGNDLQNPEHCAKLVKIALQNEADGFMFTVNENTLSIIQRDFHKNNHDEKSKCLIFGSW